MGLDQRLRLLLLTDRKQARGSLVEVVRRSLEAGVEAVLVREKDLADEQRRQLFEEIASIAKPAGCLLLGASSSPVESDGIHLASDDPVPERRPRIMGRSCHSLSDVEAAQNEGCDYVTLSPIFVSKSKPDYGPPLGLEKLAEVSLAADMPIVALGGVGVSEARRCISSGAAGVAVMGAVMTAHDPARTVAALTAAATGPELRR